MKYQYLRIFVVSEDRPPILEASGSFPPVPDRTEYLLEMFSERVDFIHRRVPFVYIPIGQQKIEEGTVQLGRIGRSLVEIVNEPPEADFAEIEMQTWRAANFLLDTRPHKDGQKVAMQDRGDVGHPLPILTSLVDHLNCANPDSGWVLQAGAMTDKATFWEVVTHRKGEITAAVFSFITPNVLKLRGALTADLKAARLENNAHTVDVTLRNVHGRLDLEKPNVVDAVDYVAEGGGSVKLKKGKKIIYDSEQEEKTIDLDDDETLTTEKRSTWKDFVGRLFP